MACRSRGGTWVNRVGSARTRPRSRPADSRRTRRARRNSMAVEGCAVTLTRIRLCRASRLCVAPRLPRLQRLRGLPDGQFAQRHQRGLLKDLPRSLRPSRGIDRAALQTVKQSARRDIHQNHFVGLLEDPIRHGLANPETGNLPDLVAQAGEILHVHGGEDVDAGVEQHLHVLPALWLADPGALEWASSFTTQVRGARRRMA